MTETLDLDYGGGRVTSYTVKSHSTSTPGESGVYCKLYLNKPDFAQKGRKEKDDNKT